MNEELAHVREQVQKLIEMANKLAKHDRYCNEVVENAFVSIGLKQEPEKKKYLDDSGAKEVDDHEKYCGAC